MVPAAAAARSRSPDLSARCRQPASRAAMALKGVAWWLGRAPEAAVTPSTALTPSAVGAAAAGAGWGRAGGCGGVALPATSDAAGAPCPSSAAGAEVIATQQVGETLTLHCYKRSSKTGQTGGGQGGQSKPPKSGLAQPAPTLNGETQSKMRNMTLLRESMRLARCEHLEPFCNMTRKKMDSRCMWVAFASGQRRRSGRATEGSQKT